jgi:hypothetical protein
MGIVSAYRPLKPSRRRVPRLPCRQRCRIVIGADQVEGMLWDISFSGLSLWTKGRQPAPQGVTLVDLDPIRLKVRPRRSVSDDEGTRYMCSVESVEYGESEWMALHRASWNRLFSSPTLNSAGESQPR